MPELLEAELLERDQNRGRPVRPRRTDRIMIGQGRRILARGLAVELRRDAHREQDVRRERHVEHLLDRHAHRHTARLVGVELGLADRLAALVVPDQRIISEEIDRDGRELDLDRGLQIFLELAKHFLAAAGGVQPGDEGLFGRGERSGRVGLSRGGGLVVHDWPSAASWAASASDTDSGGPEPGTLVSVLQVMWGKSTSWPSIGILSMMVWV